jgi:hypothetical protein
VDFENTEIYDSLYSGAETASANIYSGTKNITLNGSCYSSIAEFEASVTEAQVKFTESR